MPQKRVLLHIYHGNKNPYVLAEYHVIHRNILCSYIMQPQQKIYFGTSLYSFYQCTFQPKCERIYEPCFF